jgi:dTDP-4-dehydrorhamnose reductase/UDP-glucose 4-epimerase
MKRPILVIGRSSILAKGFVAQNPDLLIRQVGHDDIDEPGLFDGVKVLINFAFAPEFYLQPYTRLHDIDLRIAECITNYPIHYIMISSRKVYSPKVQWNAAEISMTSGMDVYGRNKVEIESALSRILGSSLTVLRPGNIIGFERVFGRQRFGSFLLNQLAEKGSIELNISPHTKRDIVPLDYFCKVLRFFCQHNLPGVFNIGAGEACSVGEVANWVVEGFGRGEVHARSSIEVDNFQLNSSKLIKLSSLVCGREAVENYCKSIGHQMFIELGTQ